MDALLSPTEELMDQLRAQLNAAIDQFASAVSTLVDLPSPDSAEEACATCRRAVQMFVLAYGDLMTVDTVKTQILVESLERAELGLKDAAAAQDETSPIWHYVDNVRRRKELVDALLEGDLPRYKEILREGLEVA